MTLHLARDSEDVLPVQRQHVEVQTVRRLEIRQSERFAVKLEAVPQNVKGAFEFQLLYQCRDEQRLKPRAVQIHHLFPELRLRISNKRVDAGWEQRLFLIPLGIRSRVPTALGEQGFLDVGFEGSF